MKFQNPACTVHKIWHASFERAHARTTRNQYVNFEVVGIKIQGINIWNFKTLVFTVNKICHASFERTHGRTFARTTRNQYAPSTSSKLGDKVTSTVFKPLL